MGATKRRRGAPIGNTNALKHGFYASWFKQLELNDLEQVNPLGVNSEIEMLRVIMRRLFEAISIEQPDPLQLAQLMNALGKNSYHLAELIRLEKELGQSQGIGETLSKAIKTVLDEMMCEKAKGGPT